MHSRLSVEVGSRRYLAGVPLPVLMLELIRHNSPPKMLIVESK